jgi:diguanylate cyclase (GGDEF)-like protein
VLLIRMVWRLAYRTAPELAPASRFSAQVFGTWGVLYVLRAAYFAASPPWTNFFAADIVVAATFAASILLVIAGTLGLLWVEILSRDSRLRSMETADPLTGMPNRRSFMAELELELRNCEKAGSGFVLVILDVDKFARVNERLGWAAGDEMLRAAASRIEAAAHWEDATGRIAGARFALLLRDPDHARALQRSNLLCTTLSGQLTASAREQIPMSVSGGLAAYPAHAKTTAEIIAQAEAALARAKLVGNRVEPALAEAPGAVRTAA